MVSSFETRSKREARARAVKDGKGSLYSTSDVGKYIHDSVQDSARVLVDETDH